MDISMFTAVAQGIGQALKGAKALHELKVDADVDARVSALVANLGDLAGKFLEAQTAHIASQEKAQQLEKRLRELDQFETERQRYALKEVAPGAFAYELRAECQGEEPIHRLCAACCAKKVKQILQFARYERTFAVHACPDCGAEIRMPHGLRNEVITVSRGRGRFEDF